MKSDDRKKEFRVGLGQIGLFQNDKGSLFLLGGSVLYVEAVCRVYERNQNFQYCMSVTPECHPYGTVIGVPYRLRLAEVFPLRESDLRKVERRRWQERKKDFIRSFGQKLHHLFDARPEARKFLHVVQTGEVYERAIAAAQGCMLDPLVHLGHPFDHSMNPLQDVDPFDGSAAQ